MDRTDDDKECEIYSSSEDEGDFWFYLFLCYVKLQYNITLYNKYSFNVSEIIYYLFKNILFTIFLLFNNIVFQISVLKTMNR